MIGSKGTFRKSQREYLSAMSYLISEKVSEYLFKCYVITGIRKSHSEHL